jgi:aspartyl-tRNA(Asn)/glutamyl-tRNA(Gln) amidotransferase subunit A
MDAWAHGSSTETSDFGPTKNPWNTDHLPGGSSGGSAAAVAAHQCLAAIGSETAGSIRQPAAWCGVYGFKPTYGRVSRYGVIAMASSTDSPGPLTKSVEDALLLTNIISGFDPYDATTIDHKLNLSPSLLQKGVKGLRIGIPQEYLLKEMKPSVIKLIKEAAKVFESLGAIVEPVSLLDPHYSIGVYTILQRSEVSSNLARFDGVRYGHDRTYFSHEAKKRMMLGTFALSTGYYDQYYKKAQKVRTLIVNDFNQAFKSYDLLIGPTSPGPALPLGAAAASPMFGEMEDILVEASSIAGLTGASIPCGFVDGLPIGLQITGAQQAESSVLQASAAYEQAIGGLAFPKEENYL